MTGSAPQHAAAACVTKAMWLNSMWHASQEHLAGSTSAAAAAFTAELAQRHLNSFCEAYQLTKHFSNDVFPS